LVVKSLGSKLGTGATKTHPPNRGGHHKGGGIRNCGGERASPVLKVGVRFGRSALGPGIVVGNYGGRNKAGMCKKKQRHPRGVKVFGSLEGG